MNVQVNHSSLIISPHISAGSKTNNGKMVFQGLLGNYNHDQTDDFWPRDSDEPLPLDSTDRVIHEQFGNTCMSY